MSSSAFDWRLKRIFIVTVGLGTAASLRLSLAPSGGSQGISRGATIVEEGFLLDADTEWVVSPTWSLSSLVLERCSLAEAHLEACHAKPSARPAYEQQQQQQASVEAEVESHAQPSSSVSAHEAQAIEQLAARLPNLLKESDCPPSTTVWGVSLAEDTAERKSLLAAFLGAREWELERAESFLAETLAWRRENNVGADIEVLEEPDVFPNDAIHTVSRKGPDGRPQTFVVIRLGVITKEALSRVDDFVAWRVREQERANAQLGSANPVESHWEVSPRGPKYTLVLDTAGMRPFHLGSDSRAALSKLTYVFTHFYPDFIGSTVVVNAPWFVTATWSAVSRFMPTWWGVRLGTMAELEEQPGWR